VIAVVITQRTALSGAAAAVGLSAAVLPAIHSHPTVLSLFIALCGWGVIAFIKSGQFADGHFALVWAAAVVLHTISFSIAAVAIWAGLRNRRPRACSLWVGVWCLCYLGFLFVLFPASAGP
jgi:hypothetical protein